MDHESIQVLLALINPIHGELDRQTYDEQVKEGFDALPEREYAVNVTAQQMRDLTQAVCFLEARSVDARTPQESESANNG